VCATASAAASDRLNAVRTPHPRFARHQASLSSQDAPLGYIPMILIAVACVVGVILLLLAALGTVRIVHAKSAMHLRVRETNRTPQLVLGAGQRWHIFLSQ
jgi:hypothetical protein